MVFSLGVGFAEEQQEWSSEGVPGLSGQVCIHSGSGEEFARRPDSTARV